MAPVFWPKEMERAVRAGLSREAFCWAGAGRAEPILLKADQGRWLCPAFDESTNRCCIYANRPFDCRLYPFVLTFDERGEKVYLAVDTSCPHVVENLWTEKLRWRAQVLAEQIDEHLSSCLSSDAGTITFRRPEFELMAPLPRVSLGVCRSDLGLARLVPGMVAELQQFFRADPRALAYWSLTGILVWVDFFNIWYKVVGGRLLLFGEADGGAFLWLPPVGDGPLTPAVEEARAVLARLGRDQDGWRIDNVPVDLLPTFLGMGFRVGERAEEFIYSREVLVRLAGRRYHGARNAVNSLIRSHQRVEFRPLEDADIPGVLSLHRRWAVERREKHPDEFYRAQLDAAMLMHYRAMRQAVELGVVGWVLEVDGEVVGYTLGYELCEGETAVVLAEVADLRVKGSAAYLFREFARFWAPRRWINAMGDSGLPNLRRAKLAWHPHGVVPVYTVRPGWEANREEGMLGDSQADLGGCSPSG